ncbi:unnamed protein product [Ranitomeya imitator]|uniref:Peroxidase n=1 Tax=Ranitomeya imitator TaxID=111125 RepID=A0ABN9MK13_9NEOB|nr:unnamed protein product [Ranitomeya imitator]
MGPRNASKRRLSLTGIQKGVTPVRLDEMAPFLDRFPDRPKAELLFSGFRDGFRIPAPAFSIPQVVRNLKSAVLHAAVVSEKLSKEVALGRMAGPFPTPPLEDLVISPLGVVPKKEPNKFRMKPILGAFNTAFKRLLKPEYEDGISLPRGWTQSLSINGFTLPSVREVSNEIVKLSTDSLKLDDSNSLMFMQWGQWLDHDVDLSVSTPTNSAFLKNVDCDKSCDNIYPCFPIKIPPTDPRYIAGSKCIPVIRTAAACSLTSPVREQMNGLTSYIDGSQIYGSDINVATLLRNNTNQLGLLAVNQKFSDNGLPFLPFKDNVPDQCSRTHPTLGLPCFVAGDVRSNEQPMLTSIHTVFMREHNRLAKELHKLNPCWSGEDIYQEARKMLGGVMQKITYKDWLPLLLGDKMSEVLPTYKSYSKDEDPTTSNVFTIAYRMGHTLVQPFIYRLAEDYSPYFPQPVVPLFETFFASWRILRQGGIDPILRGMMANKAKLNSQQTR